MVKVGIPRALWYYKYFPLWESFFKDLGAEIIVSPVTNKNILDQGVKLIVDEACLPVKVFFGHVNYLKDKVDYIFCPRIVSVEKKKFTCPKFMGIPDNLYPNISGLPQIIGPTINLSKNDRDLYKTIWEVGKLFTNNPLKVTLAWQNGLKKLKKFNHTLEEGKIPSQLIKLPNLEGKFLNIAVIGHEYLIYDSYLSMNILAKLTELDLNSLTPQMVSKITIEKELEIIPKRIFWTSAQDLLGSTFYFTKKEDVAGIILVSAFGCGPDAITQSLITHFHKNYAKKPVLLLTIDEHSGEAGITTRLEAFADLIKRKVV